MPKKKTETNSIALFDDIAETTKVSAKSVNKKEDKKSASKIKSKNTKKQNDNKTSNSKSNNTSSINSSNSSKDKKPKKENTKESGTKSSGTSNSRKKSTNTKQTTIKSTVKSKQTKQQSVNDRTKSATATNKSKVKSNSTTKGTREEPKRIEEVKIDKSRNEAELDKLFAEAKKRRKKQERTSIILGPRPITGKPRVLPNGLSAIIVDNEYLEVSPWSIKNGMYVQGFDSNFIVHYLSYTK